MDFVSQPSYSTVFTYIRMYVWMMEFSGAFEQTNFIIDRQDQNTVSG